MLQNNITNTGGLVQEGITGNHYNRNLIVTIKRGIAIGVWNL
jgi:hypothetical protein